MARARHRRPARPPVDRGRDPGAPRRPVRRGRREPRARVAPSGRAEGVPPGPGAAPRGRPPRGRGAAAPSPLAGDRRGAPRGREARPADAATPRPRGRGGRRGPAVGVPHDLLPLAQGPGRAWTARPRPAPKGGDVEVRLLTGSGQGAPTPPEARGSAAGPRRRGRGGPGLPSRAGPPCPPRRRPRSTGRPGRGWADPKARRLGDDVSLRRSRSTCAARSSGTRKRSLKDPSQLRRGRPPPRAARVPPGRAA